jgi:hypothetical protein
VNLPISIPTAPSLRIRFCDPEADPFDRFFNGKAVRQREQEVSVNGWLLTLPRNGCQRENAGANSTREDKGGEARKGLPFETTCKPSKPDPDF